MPGTCRLTFIIKTNINSSCHKIKILTATQLILCFLCAQGHFLYFSVFSGVPGAKRLAPLKKQIFISPVALKARSGVINVQIIKKTFFLESQKSSAVQDHLTRRSLPIKGRSLTLPALIFLIPVAIINIGIA